MTPSSAPTAELVLMPATVPAQGAEAADAAACARLLSAGSKSFHAAGRLLPARLRPDVTVLYAFCRIADDLVDESADGAAGLLAVRGMLDRCYRAPGASAPGVGALDATQAAVERAFARLVAAHALPRRMPEALVEGFAWDAAGRTYETLGDTLAYAARVASSVGVMMTWLMGVRDPATLARACDLGLAMQLTNIARDVGTDARLGRIYLPAAWLREAGVEPETLGTTPRFTPALGGVVKRLLRHADILYGVAETGIPRLPPDCQRAIRAARLIYADIGRVIARRGYDSVGGRASTSVWRKLVLLFRARRAGGGCDSPAVALGPPAAETRFLVVGAP